MTAIPKAMARFRWSSIPMLATNVVRGKETLALAIVLDTFQVIGVMSKGQQGREGQGAGGGAWLSKS